MGNTFISLAFLSLSKKKHLSWKLQLLSENGNVLHFPEDFCMYQRTTDGYNNLPIPKEVNNKNVNDISDVVLVSLLLNLNRFHTLFYFLLLLQVNESYGWLILRHFSYVSYIYLRLQEKQLLNQAKIGVTWGKGVTWVSGRNNSIDKILFYGFHQSFHQSVGE